jgi:hypothetical protein
MRNAWIIPALMPGGDSQNIKRHSHNSFLYALKQGGDLKWKTKDSKTSKMNILKSLYRLLVGNTGSMPEVCTWACVQ